MQRKTCGKVIDDIFLSLGLDKREWLEDIEREDSSLAFMPCIEECVSERECRKFEESCVNDNSMQHIYLFPTIIKHSLLIHIQGYITRKINT